MYLSSAFNVTKDTGDANGLVTSSLEHDELHCIFHIHSGLISFSNHHVSATAAFKDYKNAVSKWRIQSLLDWYLLQHKSIDFFKYLVYIYHDDTGNLHISFNLTKTKQTTLGMGDQAEVE